MPRFEPFPGSATTRRCDPARVTAPPYDVIDARRPGRRWLAVGPAQRRAHRPARRRRTAPTATAGGGALRSAGRRDGVLVDDDAPSFTVYRMELPRRGRRARHTTGVIGALELSRPGEGGILPHEHTTPKAKSDRLDLLRAHRRQPLAGLGPLPGRPASPTCSRPTSPRRWPGPTTTASPTRSGASTTPTGSRPSPPRSAPRPS